MADLLKDVGGALSNIYFSLASPWKHHTKEVEKVIIREMFGIPPSSQAFIRIAGLSGALAVALGAYGSHVFRHKDVDEKLKDTFEIANKYHFIHTLALLAVPFAKKPVLTGTLMTIGVSLFCGSCYFHALTANTAVRRVTPYGGFLLIFAWASFAF